MPFGSIRVLITAIALQGMVAPAFSSSIGELYGEELSIVAFPQLRQVLHSSFKLLDVDLKRPSLSSPKFKRRALLSKTKSPSSKRTQIKVNLNQSILDSYWKPAEKHLSLSSSGSSETIADTDKENLEPSSLASEQICEEKKKEQEAFLNLFRQAPIVDYNAIKESLLTTTWQLSRRGNPYINISSDKSPDRKNHHIVITQSLSKFEGKIEYPAMIDGQPYSTFIEHPPLGRAWFPDLDSIKRAT